MDFILAAAILGERDGARNTSGRHTGGWRTGGWRTGAAMNPTGSSRCQDLSRGVALRAAQKMFGDYLPRGVFAASAAAADGQLALHIEQRAGALIDRFADLTIAHCMADADVHVGPFEEAKAPTSGSPMGLILNANKNDCQLHRPATPVSSCRNNLL